MSFNTKLPDDSVNVAKISVLSDLTWMIGGISFFIIILYFSSGYLVQYSVQKISVKQEQELFSYFNLNALESNSSSNDEVFIQSLANKSKKCTNSQYDFKIHISSSKDVNAFALPGGYIVINQALIDKAKSENELFFVLAHEIGHFNNRDHLKGIGRSFVSLLISSFIGVSNLSELLSSSLSFSESQFSQNQESEADLYAVDLMECYYGHTNGATDFFQHIPNNNKELTFFSSHPQRLERIKDINSYISKQGYHSYSKKIYPKEENE